MSHFDTCTCHAYMSLLHAGLTWLTAITLLPTARNTTLYSNVSFECETNGGPLYWIINGTDSPALWNDGITPKTRQVSGTEYTSTLCIHATAANNNTQVQCGVFHITSTPVLLLIQGKYYCMLYIYIIIYIYCNSKTSKQRTCSGRVYILVYILEYIRPL